MHVIRICSEALQANPTRLTTCWLRQARPPHIGHYSLQTVCGFFNVPQNFLLSVVKQGLLFILLIQEDSKV